MENISKTDIRILKLYVHLSGTINNFTEAQCYYFLNSSNRWIDGDLITQLDDFDISDLIVERFNNFNGLKSEYNENISVLEVFKLNHLKEIYMSEGWQNPIHYFNISQDSPIVNIPDNINDSIKQDILNFIETIAKPALFDMQEDGRFSKEWLSKQHEMLNIPISQLK